MARRDGPSRYLARSPATGRETRGEFLDYLAEAEKEALPEESISTTTVDPATANPGDRLDGGLVVKRRLGRKQQRRRFAG